MAVYKPQDKRIHTFLMTLLYDEKIDEDVAKEYARDIELFGKFLEPNHKGGAFTRVHEATKIDVTAYLDHLTREKKYSPGTIRRKMSFLRKFYQHEVAAGKCVKDPTIGVPVPERTPRRPKVLTPAELQQVSEALKIVRANLGLRDVAIMQALCSGLNNLEIVKLRANDYNPRKATITTSQSRKPREIHLKPEAAAAFNAYLAVRPKNVSDAMFITIQGEGITYREIWVRFKRAGQKAGLHRRVSSNLVRDSHFVHVLMDDPAALFEVKTALGHRSLHNTQALLETALELKRQQEQATILAGPEDELFEAVNMQHAKRQWYKAKQRLSSDPEGAITMTRTFLETVAKRILKTQGEDHKGLELAPLCRRAVIAVLPQSVIGRENFSKFAQSAANLVENIRGYRNVAGDAHGTAEEAEIEKHHAEYAVSLAGATAAFLLECYETGNKAKRQAKEP